MNMTGRKDVETLMLDLLAPLETRFVRDFTQLDLGVNSAHYSSRVAGMEGFLRPLFGLVPYFAGGGKLAWWPQFLEGIKNGTNPAHPSYWGAASFYDQRIVEMTTLALGMLIAPQTVWEPLDDATKQNAAAWLATVNGTGNYTNNWAFFALFINLALKRAGMPYSEEMMNAMAQNAEACYIADGWYSDGFSGGKHTLQRDYYVPFAMQFYSLLYAVFMREEDPATSQKLIARAEIFAEDFIYWFAENGEALPFGRSLTYRFAMGAFWGALAYAGPQKTSWGVLKGLYMRHLRWWLKQDMLNQSGILTVGFAYPNLKMAEFYNSSTSPYWAFKIFFPLALAEEHPFWQAKEEPLPPLKQTMPQKEAYMLLCREVDRSHVFALNGGQYVAFEPTFTAAKYAKFAYSTAFGFSVPAGEYGLEQCAPDSMLALCENDNLYRVRHKCEEAQVFPEYHYSRWLPWQDVEIETWLIPVLPWHVRIHKIKSGRTLQAAEGGFAINREDKASGTFYTNNAAAYAPAENTALLAYPSGVSAMVNLAGERKPECIDTAPNTNVLYPRASLPVLCGALPKGESLLACAVLGQPATENSNYALAQVPALAISGNQAHITYGNTKITVMLEK